jgi:hypothetical protein
MKLFGRGFCLIVLGAFSLALAGCGDKPLDTGKHAAPSKGGKQMSKDEMEKKGSKPEP